MQQDDQMPITAQNSHRDVQAAPDEVPEVRAIRARLAAEHFVKVIFKARLRRPLSGMEKRFMRIERLARKAVR